MSDPEDVPATNEMIVIGDLNVSSYVLVTVRGKKSVKHFVAVIDEVCKSDGTIAVSFLTRQGSNFISPGEKDIATVDISDVVMILPPPSVIGGTSRTCKQLYFDIDLSPML